MSVKIQNLVKTYAYQHAVNNISFTAEKGEIVGFLGPNGAGKSTTMKITTGFIPPSEGAVEVCGYDVTTHSKETRERIGYLPEHNPLYLDMFVHEYLRFIGSTYGMKGSSLKNRVKEMINLCGLDREQNKLIGALSKGYRQRVGLAQALIHDPEVLILDEPTTGLDPNQLVEIRSLIKSVSENKTVILSTHIMQEVQALCDRVVIINKGELVADDKVEVLTGGKSDTKALSISFSSSIEFSKINDLEGVIDVLETAPNEYTITTQNNVDIRPKLFEIIQQENWNLLELKQKETGLEQVFHDLTGNGGDNV